jgi:tRNA(fMet)-specific endonuclease VapC
MAYMLDTNILSALVDSPDGPVSQRVERAGSRNICTSIIAAGEIRYGVMRKSSRRLSDLVEQLLRRIRIEPLNVPADREYGRIRLLLEKAGTLISGNDMLIAAHALATDSILVTDNVREFSRVPGLKIENWLR